MRGGTGGSSLPPALPLRSRPPRPAAPGAVPAAPQAAMMAAPVSLWRLLPPERAAALGTFRRRAPAPASPRNRADTAGARSRRGRGGLGPPRSPGAGGGRLDVLAVAPPQMLPLPIPRSCLITSKWSFCLCVSGIRGAVGASWAFCA